MLVDAKRFAEAIEDYTTALAAGRPNDTGQAARLRSGRALAYEGLYAWPLALKVALRNPGPLIYLIYHDKGLTTIL